MKLKPRPPFNFDLTATHMYLMPPGRYSNGIFSRILRLRSGKFIHVSITSNNSVEYPELFISVEPKVGKEDEREIKEKISFMFGVDDDLTDFYSIAKRDSILRYAIKDLYGLKIKTTPTLFEGIILSFCLQWTSFQRGLNLIDCLVKRFGEQLDDYYAFPTPETLANAGLEELKECKLGFRAERIKWISEAAVKGLNLEKLKSLPDDQFKKELMKIKWVGGWTAEALLLWIFKRHNAFPIDVWSSKILQTFYPKLKGKTLSEIKKFANGKWGRYKGLAFYYLMCDRKNLAQKLNLELKEKWNS